MNSKNKKICHFAVIADGNGRWAEENGLSRMEGHNYGEKIFDKICRSIDNFGIKYFTIYGFSTENRNRSKEEVANLLDLFYILLERYISLAPKNNYRFRILGSRDGLPDKICEKIELLESITQNNTGLNVQIAFNYGGRDEITRAFNKIINDNKNVAVNEDLISKYIDTHQIPDPDIIVRTGGEKRLSNFLLWQAAYSELFFVDEKWPEFSENTIERILEEYFKRDRRFGVK